MVLFIANSGFRLPLRRNSINLVTKYKMNSNEIDKLSEYIEGVWTNKDQAEECPSLWSNINVSYKRLPEELLKGPSFYVESAYNYMLDRPYKTGVVLLRAIDEKIEMKNYRVIQPEEFWYGSYDDTLLKSICSDRLIEVPEFCSTVFTYSKENDSFDGMTKPGKKCIIPRNDKKTYLDSRISLRKDMYSSWDIGRDIDTNEQVWGATTGAFVFKKITKI